MTENTSGRDPGAEGKQLGPLEVTIVTLDIDLSEET
jgi:hypothetical protein